MGVPAIIEPFEIEQGIVEEARLEILEPFQMEVPVTGYQCAENTPGGGAYRGVRLRGERHRRGPAGRQGEDRAGKWLYEGAPVPPADEGRGGGHRHHGGELRDKREETDLSTRKLRRTLRAFGNVPMVHTRVLDAIELVRKGASKARIVLKGRTEERTSP